MQEMLRILCLVLAAFALSLPDMAAADAPRIAPRPMASAFDAMQAGRWEVAARLAARAGPAGPALIEWHRLRAGRGTPQEVLAFLETHGDWPGLDYLHKQSEEAMVAATPDAVIAFYEDRRPQTGLGALNLARALRAVDRAADADIAVVLAWRTLDLSTAEHDAFMQAFPDLLAAHHEARLHMTLWRGLRDVDQMLPLVDADTRERALVARMIETGAAQADARLDALPEAAQSDPHIAHALFNRHIQKGRTAEAIELLLRQSRLENGLGEPARWSGWRRELTRSQMRAGAVRTAYDIAAVHGLVEGSHFADLEWLSGYLALTYFKDPALALIHFQRFLAAVETPISLGRAGYWIGRAQEAAGNAEAAAIAYELGALHQTSFYGLLAAERGGLPSDPALRGEDPGPWRDAEFASGDVFQAGVLALASGRLSLAERFFTHLAENLDRADLARLGKAMKDLGEPHLEVMVGKAAAGRGITLPAPYYALHPLAEMDLAVPPELALAIARRESEFDTSVASGAGAMGLMQLMPGTAEEMARAIGASGHTRAKVFADWTYNARLGAAYLARMARQFDGNIVMMSAAYNAGPARPPRWMSDFGDPRTGAVDVVDWIEHVPFNETRNYIMRVAESLPVYRARLGKDPHPVPFSQELVGDTFRQPSD
nr:lytic transglycosylase domain-containing protein [Roseovarius aestuariivivens]